MDPFGGGGELQQFEHFVAKHHFALGRGEVFPNLERRAVDLSRQAAVVQDILAELADAPGQAHATGVHQLAQRCRVGQWRVAGCQGIGQEGCHEAGTALFLWGKVAGLDEAGQLALAGQVALQQGAQEHVGMPGRVGEALVLRVWREAGVATDDAAQRLQVTTHMSASLERRLAHGLEQAAGPASQVGRAHADQRIGRQRLVGCGVDQLLMLSVLRKNGPLARATFSAGCRDALGGGCGLARWGGSAHGCSRDSGHGFVVHRL
ncbi:hypothetical protein D3C80_1137310 [compost metagenome]